MDDVAFNWFWQPPIDGQPGLIMVTDEHPGPEKSEIRFVTEALADVLAHVQDRIPKDLHLHQFGIYARDVFGLWIQISVNYLQWQTYRIHAPKFSQNDLAELWDSRQETTIG